MPAVLDRCVKHVMQTGKSKSEAYGICVNSTGWKRGQNGKWVKKAEEGKPTLMQTLLGSTASGLLAPIYTSMVVKDSINTTDPKDLMVARILTRLAKAKGIAHEAKSKMLDRAGPHYDSKANVIRFSKNTRSAVAGHELGHALAPDLWKRHLNPLLRGASGLSLGVGQLTPWLMNDQEKAQEAAIASTILGSPMLADELAASAKGYALLRRLGKSRRGAMGAFIGVPSYALLNAVPALSYAIRDKAVGWKEHT